MSMSPFDAQVIASNGVVPGASTQRASGPSQSKMAAKAASAFAAHASEEEPAGDAWGDGDIMLDDDGNVEMGGEEGSLGGDEFGGGDDEGGWDVDEDIAKAIEAEVHTARPEGDEEEGEGFVVPQHGQAPSFYWPNNSRLVFDHVIAGSFESAARLLNDQLGVVKVEPFQQIFLQLYSR